MITLMNNESQKNKEQETITSENSPLIGGIDNSNAVNPNTQNSNSSPKYIDSSSIDNKPSKISAVDIFFIALGILQIIIIIFNIAGIVSSRASLKAQYNVLGVIFIGLPILACVAMVNLLGLPVFITIKKIRGKKLVFSILSFLISLICIFILATWYFGITGAINKIQTTNFNRQINQDQEQQSAANKNSTEKTKQDAINLLQNCKVDYFVGQSSDEIITKDQNTRDWLEAANKSATGIEILENTPKTYIFASKSLTSELLNDVKQYRQACYDKKKLFIIVDDYIETEYPKGIWTKVKL